MEDAIYGNNNPSFGHFTAPAIISLLVNILIKTNVINTQHATYLI